MKQKLVRFLAALGVSLVSWVMAAQAKAADLVAPKSVAITYAAPGNFTTDSSAPVLDDFFSRYLWWAIIIGAVVITGVILLIVFLARRSRKKKQATPPFPRQPKV